ncbi:MAG TPA: protein kinase [Pyrinomonadaceae bacterium]|nr:protein kinase [Pyrinomonadaceae bacterium]
MSGTISTNTTIAQYTIVSKLGEGGMGQVWLARDTRLNRDVAIKLLPATFAIDSERLARFRREAQVLASLNHPNVAAIYGLEECDGVIALVLELVPGPTIADRIAQGPISIEEALPIARQIAEALEVAHERGIIHRDIKPANIKVTEDGSVKVLDFGLAKILTDESAESDLSHSPTLIKGTQAGVILGTAAYMSPEQARGKTVDKRADVWAFGCVLFEMLTGKKIFSGDSLTDILAEVVKEEPNWSTLPPSTPPSIERLLRRCLTKDPKQRLRDIGEARFEISDTIAGGFAPARQTKEATRTTSSANWRQVLPWAIAAIAILVTISVLYFRKSSSSVTTAGVKQFTLAQPTQGPLDLTFGGSVLLSPDGTQIVNSIRIGGNRQLFVRQLSSGVSQLLDGAQGASDPFFSPDGKWLAFFANGMLKKISLSGGAAEIITKAPNPRGGVWTFDDNIVFTPDTDAPLYRVSAKGGTAEPISSLDGNSKERSHRWPDVLPGGKAIVFSIAYEVGNPLDDASIGVLDLSTGKHKTIIKGGSFPRYVPTGHLVYARRGALIAVPFDAQRLEVTRPPVTVQEDVRTAVVNGRAQFSFSTKGDLVYIQERQNNSGDSGQLLEWVDRRGVAQGLINVRHEYSGPRLSADGRTLFVEVADPSAAIWVFDIGRGTLSRLTQGGVSYGPIPSPDGRRLAYQATRDGVTGAMLSQVDGSGEERLTSDKRFNFPTSWSPDSKQLLLTAASENGYAEVRVIDVDGDREQRPLIQGSFNIGGARFSPNGRWIAYVTDESGRNEVYIRSYPEIGTRIQVSVDGGSEPVWSRSGKELFFRNGDQTMAVNIGLSQSLVVGKPQLLFSRYALDDSSGPAYGMAAAYEVSLDGQRFIMEKYNQETAQLPAPRVILNWFDELKQRSPQ